MTMRRTLFALVVCFFGFNGVASGSEAPKIAVVDFQRIFETSNPGKRSADEMKSEHKKLAADLEKKKEEVEKLKDSLEQKALAMSEEAREEKERDLRIKINDLKTLAKRYEDRMKKLELEYFNDIQKDCFKIAEEIGEREGYLLILERRAGGIVYAPETIDITDKVIEAYNRMDAKRTK